MTRVQAHRWRPVGLSDVNLAAPPRLRPVGVLM